MFHIYYLENSNSFKFSISIVNILVNSKIQKMLIIFLPNLPKILSFYK